MCNRPKPATGFATDRRRRVAPTVFLLGGVSLVSDVSSESVSAILPNYLVLVVGLSPQAFGVVNGLCNGVSALVRRLAGWLDDRTDRPTSTAAVGYAVLAVGKFALLAAHTFPRSALARVFASAIAYHAC